MATFSADHKAALDELLLGYPGLRPGKMFGFPAYYAGAKLCITLYEAGVGLKLPAHAETLSAQVVVSGARDVIADPGFAGLRQKAPAVAAWAWFTRLVS